MMHTVAGGGVDPVALLDRPVYGMGQAARLLGLRPDGIRRWIDGYERQGKQYAPVIRERRTGVDFVTWGEFVEPSACSGPGLGLRRADRASGGGAD
jgi:hypothetical protein